METECIRKDEIINPKSLRMGGNLHCPSFNGVQTPDEAEAHAIALLLAARQARIENKSVRTVFGINRKDVADKMCMMIGVR